MKILVTGGNGYLGKHVVNALVERNFEVTISTSLYHINNTKKTNCLPFDIYNFDGDLFQAAGEPDIILNLAWKDGFSHSNLTHFDFAYKQHRFIHKMLQGGLKHIVSIGSMHEIGYYVGPVDENTPTNPSNNYGIAKTFVQRSQQQLCLHYNAVDQWLRCFYIIGDDERSNSVFTKLMQADKNGEAFFPLTDGEVLLDFINVNLLAKMIVNVATQKKVTGIINCCSGKPVSLKTKIMEFIDQNHLSINPNWGAFPFRPYDSRAIWGDIKKRDLALETYALS